MTQFYVRYFSLDFSASVVTFLSVTYDRINNNLFLATVKWGKQITHFFIWIEPQFVEPSSFYVWRELRYDQYTVHKYGYYIS